MKRYTVSFARLPRVVLSLGAAALLGSLAVPAHSAIITVDGLITVTADDGASFKNGDTFTYSFTFDDQTTDTDTQTYNARFNAAVSAFSLSRGAANVGTWDPAAGTFDVAPVLNFIAGANSDSVTIQVTGSNSWKSRALHIPWRERRPIPVGRSRNMPGYSRLFRSALSTFTPAA